jgi:hypothetical protein
MRQEAALFADEAGFQEVIVASPAVGQVEAEALIDVAVGFPDSCPICQRDIGCASAWAGGVPSLKLILSSEDQTAEKTERPFFLSSREDPFLPC